MKLIAFIHKAEGDSCVQAVLTFYRTKVSYDGEAPILRGLGFCLLLPTLFHSAYLDRCDGCWFKGWRTYAWFVRLGFVRGNKRDWYLDHGTASIPIGKRVLLATQEQVQDGEVII